MFQDLASSKDYFKRRVDYVQEQLDKIDILGTQKSEILNAVLDVIELKVQSIKQQSAAAS